MKKIELASLNEKQIGEIKTQETTHLNQDELKQKENKQQKPQYSR